MQLFSNAFFVRARIVETDFEFSYLTESFSFEDSVSMDSEATFQLNGLTIDQTRDTFKLGQTIEFRFGYIKGEQSELITMRLSGLQPFFSDTIKYTLKCRDFGTIMKGDKTGSGEPFINRTASDIARIIAFRNGLKIDFVPTTKIYENLPQGSENDYRFLKQLAILEDQPYDSWIRGKTLYFKPKNIDNSSLKTFAYRGFAPNITAFEANVNETNQNKTMGNGELKPSGYDPVTKKQTAVKDAGQVKLKDTYLGRNAVNPNYTIAQTVGLQTYDTRLKQNKLNTISRNASRKLIVATLDTELTPFLAADDIVSVLGVGQWQGTYYIDTIRHEGSSGGATTSITLNKNATDTSVNVSPIEISKSDDVSINNKTDDNSLTGVNNIREKSISNYNPDTGLVTDN